MSVMEDLERQNDDAATVAMARNFISIKYVPGLQICRNLKSYYKLKRTEKTDANYSRKVYLLLCFIKTTVLWSCVCANGYEIAFFVLILSGGGVEEWQSVRRLPICIVLHCSTEWVGRYAWCAPNSQTDLVPISLFALIADPILRNKWQFYFYELLLCVRRRIFWNSIFSPHPNWLCAVWVEGRAMSLAKMFLL